MTEEISKLFTICEHIREDVTETKISTAKIEVHLKNLNLQVSKNVKAIEKNGDRITKHEKKTAKKFAFFAGIGATIAVVITLVKYIL